MTVKKSKFNLGSFKHSRTFVSLLCMIFVVLLLAAPSFAESKKKLTHEMTEAEKALMPAYLENLAQQRAITSAPPATVRGIAEFEPMEGVLIAYPLGIPTTVVKEMADDIMVYTLVASATDQNRAISAYTSAGVNLSNCTFIIATTDSYWTRDYGPWFVTDGTGTVGVVDFIYNRPRPNDNNVPTVVANHFGINLYGMDLVHCGGNYMTEGHGISVSTELVLEENTSLTASQINQIMLDYHGIQTYHVTADPLGDYIKHVDCWGKYLDVDKIMIAEVPSNHSQYQEYENVATYFAGQTSGYGNNYQVVRVYEGDSEPYTNSLILNNKVLVPIMGTSADTAAISAYQQAMPGYEVIGCTGSWMSTDALHCRAKGIADRTVLYIKHMPLLGQQPVLSGYSITADIIPFSGQAVTAGSARIYYSVNGGTYSYITMTNSGGDTYTGTIPGQTQGSEIAYYIYAADNSGKTATHPYIGQPDPHSFTAGVAIPTPPAAPTGLAVNATACNQMDLAWTDNSNNEDGFKIERSLNGTTFTLIATTGANATTYSDMTVAENTAYWYRISATNSIGDSSYSNTASATTPTCPALPPNAPSVTLTRGRGMVYVNWIDNSTNEDGFNIYRGTSSTNLVLVATVGANVTSYTDSGLSRRTTYYYKVCAYNANGEGCSPVSSVKTQ
jgi:agmatine deiminase